MKISKTSLAERMIALLLAAVVVVSAIPIGALRVSAATLVQLSGSVTDQDIRQCSCCDVACFG